MTGGFAKSKAGHDKGQLYIIVKEENEYVYLADGKGKTLEHPKKKKKKHIQIINKYYDEALCEKFRQSVPIQDEEIKRAIKLIFAEADLSNSMEN